MSVELRTDRPPSPPPADIPSSTSPISFIGQGPHTNDSISPHPDRRKNISFTQWFVRGMKIVLFKALRLVISIIFWLRHVFSKDNAPKRFSDWGKNHDLAQLKDFFNEQLEIAKRENKESLLFEEIQAFLSKLSPEDQLKIDPSIQKEIKEHNASLLKQIKNPESSPSPSGLGNPFASETGLPAQSASQATTSESPSSKPLPAKINLDTSLESFLLRLENATTQEVLDDLFKEMDTFSSALDDQNKEIFRNALIGKLSLLSQSMSTDKKMMTQHSYQTHFLHLRRSNNRPSAETPSSISDMLPVQTAAASRFSEKISYFSEQLIKANTREDIINVIKEASAFCSEIKNKIEQVEFCGAFGEITQTFLASSRLSDHKKEWIGNALNEHFLMQMMTQIAGSPADFMSAFSEEGLEDLMSQELGTLPQELQNKIQYFEQQLDLANTDDSFKQLLEEMFTVYREITNQPHQLRFAEDILLSLRNFVANLSDKKYQKLFLHIQKFVNSMLSDRPVEMRRAEIDLLEATRVPGETSFSIFSSTNRFKDQYNKEKSVDNLIKLYIDQFNEAATLELFLRMLNEFGVFLNTGLTHDVQAMLISKLEVIDTSLPLQHKVKLNICNILLAVIAGNVMALPMLQGSGITPAMVEAFKSSKTTGKIKNSVLKQLETVFQAQEFLARSQMMPTSTSTSHSTTNSGLHVPELD